MTERVAGPMHSLLRKPRAPPPWRTAAAELLSSRRTAVPPRGVRRRLHHSRRRLQCKEALIRQEFAFRFAITMQEICPRRRQAALAQLMVEEQAALRRAREAALADEHAERERHRGVMAARAPRIRIPRRPRFQRSRSSQRFGDRQIC